MPKPLTPKQQAFLEAYRTYGIVRIAAAKAGVSRELHYNALRVSETYRHALAAIEKEHALHLEEQARTIARNQGDPEPVFYGRKLVGFKRRFSDKLLVFLLEANNPEKFRHPKAPRQRRPKPDTQAISRPHRPARTRRRPLKRRPPPTPHPVGPLTAEQQARASLQKLHALRLEEEARTIAIQGLPEPVYYGRQIVGVRRRYSDRLLIRLLEANNPAKFRRPRSPARQRRKPDTEAISSTPFANVDAEMRARSFAAATRHRGSLCSRPEPAGRAEVKGASRTEPRLDTPSFRHPSTARPPAGKRALPPCIPHQGIRPGPGSAGRWLSTFRLPPSPAPARGGTFRTGGLRSKPPPLEQEPPCPPLFPPQVLPPPSPPPRTRPPHPPTQRLPRPPAHSGMR
ncbi:hypothetical protein VT03_14575 [Planctomyces sp. SH-PL14]|nr:hypothetical protein VT03_14575 [Planctomyces sp. SH-PL14]